MKKEVIFLFAVLLIFFTTTVNSIGYYHADEHFELLEFASYKAGNPNTHLSDLAWEFKAQIRASAQVFIAYGVMKACYAAGIDNPFTIAMLLRGLSALLSLGCLLMIYLAFRRHFKQPFSSRAFLFLSFCLWFLPFLAVRFASETWSGACFFLALGWLVLKPEPQRIWSHLCIGLLLGLSFLFRYQAGFMIAGLLAWLIVERKAYRHFSFYLLPIGILFMAGAGIFLDHWLYGDWVFCPWRYVDLNLFQGKANSFGVSHWYQYFLGIPEKATPFIGLIIIVAMLWLWIKRPKHILTWVSLPFVLVHICLSHKELRFLNPLIFMLPVAIGFLLNDIRLQTNYRKAGTALFLLFNIPLLLYVMLMPANMAVKALNEAYTRLDKEGHVRLFYTSVDPLYTLPSASTFYLPRDSGKIERIQVKDPLDIPKGKNKEAILYTSQLDLDKSQAADVKIELVNQRLPRLLTSYGDIFHWVERTTIDCVYRCEPKQKEDIVEDEW